MNLGQPVDSPTDFDSLIILSFNFAISGLIDNAGVEQVKVCLTIHLPFNGFQTVNLSFGLPSAPRQAKHVPHGRFVGEQAVCLILEIFNFTPFNFAQPIVEAIGAFFFNNILEADS